uniref:DNA repair and recombination protein mus-11 n=2 Tax=Neurospora crassa (strain ATCC 24698 / 74-OR23-1A / CBS 708.71 / DSM 1257 / FGSC 987) TaxID=367110 RepID=RAD52_NEUCR|nr:RecName: Full=DNA repair and recombination protein mus-11; AltName: Full=Mutagen-sensitive protein 11; AltName: Full=RAD52 homolog [Neurospora crassa OR74A]BAB13343.1 MUS11 [Neurospora crassa]CAC28736.1 Double Strand Break repair protein mus-11 [Neurospora crassa]
MPAVGDQHKLIANPFEEPQRRISEYTAQEIATLQSRLEKQLGPEYLSSRAGPSGQKVHYISSEKCIQLANEVFGFNGWSSSIQNIQVDFVDEHPQTLKINMGISVIMRVTLRDGTYHEDLGYGHIENCKGKAAAFEKAKKEATTDALKRALRQFGNVLGNCIYDKQYLAKVTKMKVEPTKFAEDNLHRHSDFVKKEPVEADIMKVDSVGAGARPPALGNEESFEDLLGELDEADFNMADEGHPDEVVLPQAVHNSLNDKPVHQQLTNLNPQAQQSRPLSRSGSTGSLNTRQQPQNSHQFTARAQSRPPQQQLNSNQSRPMGQPVNNSSNANTPNNPQNYTTPQKPAPAAPAPQAGAAVAPAPETVGFFSAKAVTQLPEEALASGQVAPKPGLAFNPHAESPSIRKTPGIDHTKSKPLARNGQHVPPAKTTETEAEPSTSLSRPAGAHAASRPVTMNEARSASGSFSRAGPPMGGNAGNMGKPNVVNPQLDHTRRIGAPGMSGFSSSPSTNRGQYRPLTMKRPAPVVGGGAGQTKDGNGDSATTTTIAANTTAGSATGGNAAPSAGNGGRVPLTDMSANASNATAAGAATSGPEVKRQRLA